MARKKRDSGMVGSLLITLLASFMMVFVAMIYFVIVLLLVKFASEIIGYQADGGFAVLSASVLVIGCIGCCVYRVG